MLPLNNLILEFEKVSNISTEDYSRHFPENLKSKIEQKRNGTAQIQSAAAYLLLNRILNANFGLSLKGLIFTKNGKPYFAEGPFVSLSHSGEYVCAAVSDTPLGVDIEQIREFNLSVLDRFFTRREKHYILKKDTQKRFFTLWTLKEAIIKREGRSLSNLSEIKLKILFNRIFYKNYKLYTEIHENYVISACFDEKTGK